MTIEEFDSLYTEVGKTPQDGGEEARPARPQARHRRGTPARPQPEGSSGALSLLHQNICNAGGSGNVLQTARGPYPTRLATCPFIKDSLPTPKIYAKVGRIKTIGELEKMFRGLTCLTDASEQPIQKPKRRDMEKSHYSGKAHTHSKGAVHHCDGLIVHKTAHLNDITIFVISGNLFSQTTAS